MPKKEDIIQKLIQLSDIREVNTSLLSELGTIATEALKACPDLKERYDEVNSELSELTKKAREITEEVTSFILQEKETIKGGKLQAVFSKGKTTWDSKKLEGYALAHPELKKLKKEGKPSVSIREVKEKE